MGIDTPRAGSVFAIVLTWNNVQDTMECLESLKGVQYSRLQVVCVDNGSSDDTVTVVRNMFPEVCVIENGRNLGYAEGNNVGIRYALERGAEYILLLNNDAVTAADAISQMIRVAEANPEIGMLCPTLVSYFNPTREYVGGQLFRGLGVGVEVERSPDGLPEHLDTDYAPGCALLVKADVIRQVGLLDADFFAYFEDVDWSLRARQKGFRVAVVPQARVLHKGAMDQTGRKSPLASFLFWRNRFLFVRKHAPRKHWPGFLKSVSRDLVLRVSDARAHGDNETAGVMIDGFWAGLIGQKGEPRIGSPHWWRWLVGDHLAFWDWLTRWLYFWDYRRVKRQRSKSQDKPVKA